MRRSRGRETLVELKRIQAVPGCVWGSAGTNALGVELKNSSLAAGIEGTHRGVVLPKGPSERTLPAWGGSPSWLGWSSRAVFLGHRIDANGEVFTRVVEQASRYLSWVFPIVLCQGRALEPVLLFGHIFPVRPMPTFPKRGQDFRHNVAGVHAF